MMFRVNNQSKMLPGKNAVLSPAHTSGIDFGGAPSTPKYGVA